MKSLVKAPRMLIEALLQKVAEYVGNTHEECNMFPER